MADLRHFAWSIDQDGYQPISAEVLPLGVESPILKDPPVGGGWCIRRKGGPLKEYWPLEAEPGLARRFAYLSREPQEILDFANEFGFLGFGRLEHPDELAWEEPVSWWRTHIQGVRHVVEGIDAGAKYEMASIFNDYVGRDKLSMIFQIETGEGKLPSLKMAPTNLLSAMWFQIAEELTGSINIRQCERCPRWFRYGSGTQHRKTKRFCSDRCRKASNRQQGSGS